MTAKVIGNLQDQCLKTNTYTNINTTTQHLLSMVLNTLPELPYLIQQTEGAGLSITFNFADMEIKPKRG